MDDKIPVYCINIMNGQDYIPQVKDIAKTHGLEDAFGMGIEVYHSMVSYVDISTGSALGSPCVREEDIAKGIGHVVDILEREILQHKRVMFYDSAKGLTLNIRDEFERRHPDHQFIELRKDISYMLQNQ
ncbi:MAG: hypothetical protein HGA85_07835 [Nanoarchaeota archaeon]|nr:hypothetical protein [Nanoarchaeota archaeon]